MKISGTDTGASTYAMKKAMEMPNLLLNLVQQTADSGQGSLETKSAAGTRVPDPAASTGKGRIIDIVG